MVLIWKFVHLLISKNWYFFSLVFMIQYCLDFKSLKFKKFLKDWKKLKIQKPKNLWKWLQSPDNPVNLTTEDNLTKLITVPVLRIRKILASWIWIRKNMRIHGSGSKGQIINQILQKKYLLSKPKSELLKKRDYKNFLISEWFIKF